MSIKLSYIRRYRFDENTIKKLEQLKEIGVVESRFIRAAISEKIERDFKKLKEKKDEFICPF